MSKVPEIPVQVIQRISEMGIGISSADRCVRRSFNLPFVPVAGMTLIDGDWECVVREVTAVRVRDAWFGDSWMVRCYTETDRRRKHDKSMSVAEIVAEYKELGWGVVD